MFENVRSTVKINTAKYINNKYLKHYKDYVTHFLKKTKCFSLECPNLTVFFLLICLFFS